MILHAAGEADGVEVQAVRRYYAEAEKLGTKSSDVFYPAMNVIAVEVMSRPGSVPAARFKAVREVIAAKLRDDPDFWSAAGDVELTLYEALNSDELAPQLAALESDLEDLHARWPSQLMWSSVRDQARFVLPRYARRGRVATEEQAAASLLEKLEAYAAEAPVPEAAPPVKPAPSVKPAPQLKLVPPVKTVAHVKSGPQIKPTPVKAKRKPRRIGVRARRRA
jgi:hypothetical protein